MSQGADQFGSAGPGDDEPANKDSSASVTATERDVLTIGQIVDACKSIERFCKDRTFDDFANDDMLSSAVERKITIIGEAASPNSKRLNDAFKDMHPEVPWKQLAGMRNIPTHQYDTVRLRIVWETAIKDIPALRATLEPVLEREARRLALKDLG